jgi:hypothetical protein
VRCERSYSGFQANSVVNAEHLYIFKLLDEERSMKKVLRVIVSGLFAAAAGYGAILAYRRVRPERRDGHREQGELLDLNTCTPEQLAKLPGMRPDLLDRVMENRPYRNKLDLVSRLVLPQFEYEQVSHLIVVRDREEPVKVA